MKKKRDCTKEARIWDFWITKKAEYLYIIVEFNYTSKNSEMRLLKVEIAW